MTKLKIKIIFILFIAITPAAIAADDCSQFANNINLLNACKNLQRDVQQAQQDSLNSLNNELQKQNPSQIQTITPPPQTNIQEQAPLIQTQQPTTTPSPTTTPPVPRARIHY